MPRSKSGKSKYTNKQERKAEHIEEGYEKKGVGKKRAKQIAWATVNKQSGGGEAAGGSGRKTSAKKKAAAKKSSAKNAAQTRKAGKRKAPTAKQNKAKKKSK